MLNLALRGAGFEQTGRDPVVCVNWADANAYASWLAGKTGQPYRLPSEAEWEYMARAGNPSTYHFGADERAICNYGNGADLSTGFENRNTLCDDGSGEKTVPVGGFPPNRFGVHDTIGNAWEWTADCWHGGFQGAPADARPWTTGGDCKDRVLKGGSWVVDAWGVRSSVREGSGAEDRDAYAGFRVARPVTGAP